MYCALEQNISFQIAPVHCEFQQYIGRWPYNRAAYHSVSEECCNPNGLNTMEASLNSGLMSLMTYESKLSYSLNLVHLHYLSIFQPAECWFHQKLALFPIQKNLDLCSLFARWSGCGAAEALLNLTFCTQHTSTCLWCSFSAIIPDLFVIVPTLTVVALVFFYFYLWGVWWESWCIFPVPERECVITWC